MSRLNHSRHLIVAYLGNGYQSALCRPSSVNREWLKDPDRVTADCSLVTCKACLREMAKAPPKAVEHWEDNLRKAQEGRFTEIDISSSAYALCPIYLSAGRQCRGCPVWRRTGKTMCRDTPYDRVSRWMGEVDWLREYDTDLEVPKDLQGALVVAIYDEVKFLQSLT